MSKPVRKISRSGNSLNPYTKDNRFEHWLISNQVYFITARCRDKIPAFKTEEAKATSGIALSITARSSVSIRGSRR